MDLHPLDQPLLLNLSSLVAVVAQVQVMLPLAVVEAVINHPKLVDCLEETQVL
jgi:hypothetical protein